MFCKICLVKDFTVEMFFMTDPRDADVLELKNLLTYRQFKTKATWQDSLGDYGDLNCLGSYTSLKDEGTFLKYFCRGANQNNDEFWLTLTRDSKDYDAGIGRTTYISGTGRYQKLKGLKCNYGVKILDNKNIGFVKQKCKFK